jgi:hypothetical protein
MLPKFLLADNSQEMSDTIFVIHNESPRFIVESDIEDFWTNQEVHWIDEVPANEEFIEHLLGEAEDFLITELDNQDEYFEDGEDD